MTQAVMTLRMSKYVQANRVAPCKRAHDLVVGVDFAAFADGLSTAVAQCRRCSCWFNHVMDALSPAPSRNPVGAWAQSIEKRRARMCRCTVIPSMFPPGQPLPIGQGELVPFDLPIRVRSGMPAGFRIDSPAPDQTGDTPS